MLFFRKKKETEESTKEKQGVQTIEKTPVESKPAPVKPEPKKQVVEPEPELPVSGEVKVKVLEQIPCGVILNVELGTGRINDEKEKACLYIQTKARMPGFRTGKVPLDIIKQQFTTDVERQTANNVVGLCLEEALKEAKKVTGKDSINSYLTEKPEFTYDKPFTIKIAVETEPEFSLKSYKGLTIKKDEKEVTQDIIAKEIDNLRQSYAKLVEAGSETVENSHILVADYEAYADGALLKELSALGRLIDMSAPGEIAGLPEALLGAKAGETKSLKVKVPGESPNKELAGKELEFKIKIQAIKTKKLPELNDEWAKDIGCHDLTDLKGRVETAVKENYAKETKNSIEKQIVEKLLEEHVFQVPLSYVAEETKFLEKKIIESRKGAAATAKGQSSENGELPEDLKKWCQAEAERRVRLSYIFSNICKAEKFNVTETEIEELHHRILQNVEAGEKPKIREMLKSRRGRTVYQLLDEKVMKFLLDNANVTTGGEALSCFSTSVNTGEEKNNA